MFEHRGNIHRSSIADVVGLVHFFQMPQPIRCLVSLQLKQIAEICAWCDVTFVRRNSERKSAVMKQLIHRIINAQLSLSGSCYPVSDLFRCLGR